MGGYMPHGRSPLHPGDRFEILNLGREYTTSYGRRSFTYCSHFLLLAGARFAHTRSVPLINSESARIPMCLSSPKARRHTVRSQRSRVLQGRRRKAQAGPKFGRWEKREKLAFLQGLRLFGRGKWKRIGDNIPSRQDPNPCTA